MSHQSSQHNRRVAVVVVPNLFFATRITETANRLGVALEHRTSQEALEAIRRGRPDLVIIDLHAPGDPLGLAQALKSDPATRGVTLVGFYAHVDHAVRDAARDAGVDHVLARSAFAARLPLLLAGGEPKQAPAHGAGEDGTEG